jgi:hypothetical protein
VVGTEAAAAGPRPEPLDRFGIGHRHRHDILRRLDQRHIEQCCQPAAGADLSPRPLVLNGERIIVLDLDQSMAPGGDDDDPSDASRRLLPAVTGSSGWRTAEARLRSATCGSSGWSEAMTG